MSPSELIEQWKFRVHRVQLAHYESARRFERMHLWLGLPAIALSTIVGTAVFASLSKTADLAIQIAVGLLSVAAAVLTGLQTFLKYSELSESTAWPAQDLPASNTASSCSRFCHPRQRMK